ncbi:hypothetical protein FisN_4Lh503 [Fistulifera solaris]|uniref:HMG box domain-containing protein n=1 Tax=Fistulifera solaris TaxID=1519565 RepID=A0A1Z5KE49_FISSO|nr:hypothetical protein FisN_4Lh503 [Fistulifera solaris]|eukprot:GAX24382.1 hypothetical protein FisN_4Lh503 [Fistulifera solaris]
MSDKSSQRKDDAPGLNGSADHKAPTDKKDPINEGEGKTTEEPENETNKENKRQDEGDIEEEDDDDDTDSEAELFQSKSEDKSEVDPETMEQNELIEKSTPTTPLEIALTALLKRKETYIQRITGEIAKLKKFVSKRKQTYKRKRKEEGAPTRALSAYNIFIQDRFAKLAKENENALKSEDTEAELKRVPPSYMVASTGNAWKELPPEEKALYYERAKADQKRYEEEMAAYQPPDKQANRKRNKTGYNMFFTAHVHRLKQTENGVPSERGSVARLVGNAWKNLTPDERQYYEREADKHNGMNLVKDGDEDDDEDEVKRQQMEHYHMHGPHPEMHMHPGMHPVMHMHPAVDPRHAYYPPHMYGQPMYSHYDYSQHHRHQQARAQGYNQAYPPPPRSSYETGTI